MDPSELKGWELLREYLVDASVTHADVVRRLEELYGSGYNDEIWRPTLNRIMELEPDEDSNNLLDFVNEKIRECSIITHPTPSSSSSIAPVEESPKKRVSVKEYAARKAKRSSAKEQSAIATSSSSALPATATSTLSSSSSFPPAPPVSSSTAETVSTALPSEDLIQSSPVLRYFDGHLAVAHLAVIPYPSDNPDHSLFYAWYQPDSMDFVPVNDTPGLTGIGILTDVTAERVRTMCGFLLRDIEELPDRIKNDRFLVEARNRLRKLLDRLSIPGSRYHVFLQLSCVQRLFLETYARKRWLMKWAPRYAKVDDTFELDRDIMGAFTDDLDIAADLFRVGIPVWLIRPLDVHQLTKIIKTVAPLDETHDHRLPLRNSSGWLDVGDKEPAHPLIYSGLPGSFERYSKMARFIHEQFNTALVGTFTSTNVSSRSSIPPLPPSSTPAQTRTKELEALDVTSRDAINLPPLRKKQKTGHTSGNHHEERNRFLAIKHDLFPHRVSIWDDAQLKLKDFHRRIGSSFIENPLLDPALFVSPDNTFRTSFFMMWLRVRPVFLWRLSLPTGTKFYSNKDWRKMLESADGRKLSSLKGRTEMLQELKDVVADSRQYGIEIDVDNIATATAFWRGAPVIVLNNGMPESDVVVAAIWELYEINFRMELLILDRKLIPEPARDDERAEWMERETVINQCWPGLMFRPDSGSPGLSSYDNAFDHYRRRIPFLKAFHHLVQSWPGPKPTELMNEFPVVDEDDLTPIRNVETALAHYYTRTFLKVYQRPATIPHYIT